MNGLSPLALEVLACLPVEQPTYTHGALVRDLAADAIDNPMFHTYNEVASGPNVQDRRRTIQRVLPQIRKFLVGKTGDEEALMIVHEPDALVGERNSYCLAVSAVRVVRAILAAKELAA